MRVNTAFLLSLFLVVFGTPISASAQTQNNAELGYIAHKYKVATLADMVHEKCGGLTDIGKSAAKHARERYTEQAKAGGLSNDVTTFEKTMVAVLARTSCPNVQRDAQVISTMNEVQGLTDEYLLAILRSGITTCGDYKAKRVSAVIALAREAETRLKARADYTSVNNFATEAGAEFAETCANSIVSDAFFLTFDPVGSVFIYTIFKAG